MRVTESMVMNHYSKTVNKKYSQLVGYSNQISSTMAFDRASDDPVAAMQAMKGCHEYTYNQQFQTSQKLAMSWLNTTETSAKEINNVLITAREKATEALNGTNSGNDLKNYADAMESYRNEIVSALNSTYNGQYIFGEGESGSAPFRLDDDGNLQVYNYNSDHNSLGSGYINVNTLKKSDLADLRLQMNIDLGLDNTFDAAISGLDVIISGYSSEDGTAINIVDQLTAAIDGFNNDDSDKYSGLIDNISDAQDAVLRTEAVIGEKTNMLNEINTCLGNKEVNITNSLANSMEVDSVKAISQYNMCETVFNESLSMAATILQNSLLDFLK